MQSASKSAGAAGMCTQTSTCQLLLPTRATRHLAFPTYVNMTLMVIIELSIPNAPTAPKSESPNASFAPHEDFDISIIWHNLDSRSDFLTFRKESRGPIERILVDFARVLESGMFEVYSVNASKHLFCVTVACAKNKDGGVMDLVLSVR